MHFTSREWYFSMKFFFEEVKNYVQVCSEKGLKRFVQPKNYKERVVFKFWEEKLLLKFFQELFLRTACMINFDKVVKSAFNLSREDVSPFLLENQIVTRKALWEPEVSGRVVRTAFYFSRVTFWGNNFFWRKKRFFLSSFPTFCWNFSKFRIHIGNFEKRFRNCWCNCTPLVRSNVSVGKICRRSFQV